MSRILKKYILYGVGTICDSMVSAWSYLNPALLERVLCYTDSRPETWGSTFHNRPVIPPDEISHYDYDRIIITTEKYAKEIYQLLCNQYQVPSYKIFFVSGGSLNSDVVYNDKEYDTCVGTGHMKKQGEKKVRYQLYLEKEKAVRENCVRDWRLKGPQQVSEIKNGYVLPARLNHMVFSGGICDEDGNFVEGHRRSMDPGDVCWCTSAYTVPEHTQYHEETVVYGGFILPHYGHMITESLSRLWWFLDHPNSGYQYVFLMPMEVMHYLDFLYMLGLDKKDILIIREPMQFKAIIIPDQAIFLLNGGYREKILDVYNRIRDSVLPGTREKIYLTRTNYNRRVINEEYFENQFRKMGYEVVSPEQLPINEQVALMAGARKIACTSGTLPHQILFCQDGIEITILNRTTTHHQAQYWINQARKAECTLIDVSMNFFEHGFFLMPTTYFQQYAANQGLALNDSNKTSLLDFSRELAEFINQWMSGEEYGPFWVSRFPVNILLADIFFDIYRKSQGKEPDEIMKQRIWLRLGVDFMDM